MSGMSANTSDMQKVLKMFLSNEQYIREIEYTKILGEKQFVKLSTSSRCLFPAFEYCPTESKTTINHRLKTEARS